MDHLIHMLVMEYLPYIEICHKWQSLGMEGLDLSEKHHQQILVWAPETPLANVQKINDLHFEVQSLNSNKYYQINLVTTTCSCSDFPHIHLCKHVAAVKHYFGGVGAQSPGNVGTGMGTSAMHATPDLLVQKDGSSGSTDDSATASIVLAANDMIYLCQRLLEVVTKVLSDPDTARSIKKCHSQLQELVVSAMAAGNGSSLPEIEPISLNQHTWLETAVWMGVKQVNRCGKGKVNSALMAQHIGKPNYKCASNNNDMVD